MSAYNIKWLGIYLIYAIIAFWLYIEGYIYDRDLFYTLILTPSISYLVLPLILKRFGHWKIVIWLDKLIDYWYQTIKECTMERRGRGMEVTNHTLFIEQKPEEKKRLLKNKRIRNVLTILLQVVGLLLLLMVAGFIPYVGVPAIIVFFWINWDRIFKNRK